MSTVIEALVSALHAAAAFDRNTRVPPIAVLWPDPSSAWSAAIPQLQRQIPLARLGAWDESGRSGPAIWLRTVVTGNHGDRSPHTLRRPGDESPWVIYLPGVARNDLRAAEDCPPHLKPLVEMQYRCDWWQQSSGRPWTPSAFLRSKDGPALDIAQDDATARALTLALPEILLKDIDDLTKGRIEADDLTALLVGDTIGSVLAWLEAPDETRTQWTESRWQAFCQRCRSGLEIDPEAEGPLGFARKLGEARGPWKAVWDRFAEHPTAYPVVRDLLRDATPTTDGLFIATGTWEADNDRQEHEVAHALTALAGASPGSAIAVIDSLEQAHGHRRDSVWAAFGGTIYADVLAHLAELARRVTSLPTADADLRGLIEWYADQGWRIDALAVQALRAARPNDMPRAPSRHVDRTPVLSALGAVYQPWLDGLARRFQHVTTVDGYGADTNLASQPGDCLLFVDGLRLDSAHALETALSGMGTSVSIRHRLAPFPTVTPTGKPAVTSLSGLVGAEGFDVVTARRKTLHGGGFRSALSAIGVTALSPTETGDPTAIGWTESADIDSIGHNQGLKLAEHLPAELAQIACRAQELLAAGWKRVRIVTDHGWLLLPSPASAVELKQHLTNDRKPRAARLGPQTGPVAYPTLPWTWDPTVRMVSPPGIHTFIAGGHYHHGGLSLQECVVPIVTVTVGSQTTGRPSIAAAKWIGMRCRVDVEAPPAGGAVEIRTSAALSSSTKAKASIDAHGEARPLVDDDGLVGATAYVVLLDEKGTVIAQQQTIIGGN